MVHEVPQGQRLPLVQDVARALKPGGFVFVIEWRTSRSSRPETDEQHTSRKDLLKLGTDAGLSHDAEFHYLKHQVFLRFRKPALP